MNEPYWVRYQEKTLMQWISVGTAKIPKRLYRFVNLQYNTPVRWDAQTKGSSTKRLMFQALLFFRYFL